MLDLLKKLFSKQTAVPDTTKSDSNWPFPKVAPESTPAVEKKTVAKKPAAKKPASKPRTTRAKSKKQTT